MDITSITAEEEINESEEQDCETNYCITAEYKGTIAKSINNRIHYSVYFTGTKITPSPTPLIIEPPAEADQPTSASPKIKVLLICLNLLCGVALFFHFRRHIRVYNLNGEAYIPLGKASVSFTCPVINLTPFANKAVTGGFVLIFDRVAARKLTDKAATINYGGKSLQHIILYDGGEYQIKVDF